MKRQFVFVHEGMDVEVENEHREFHHALAHANRSLVHAFDDVEPLERPNISMYTLKVTNFKLERQTKWRENRDQR